MAAIPLFSSLVRWSDWDGMWEICFPAYSLNSDTVPIWTHTPQRYSSNQNLCVSLTLAKREHLANPVLNSTGLYVVYADDDAIEITTDDVIMDILLKYSHI